MTTGTPGVADRRMPRQVLNTMVKRVNYNDVGIADGLPFDQYLPMGARLVDVQVEIITPFNGGTTNVLTAGTVGTAYNNLVAAGDVDEAAAAVTKAGRGLGRGLTAAAAVRPYAKYTQSGTAATAGQADILLVYEGGWAS